MCHLVAEKSLKAHFAALKDSVPPYTHNLRKLAEESGAYSKMSDEQKDLLDVLQPLNIEARYPTHKERLRRTLTEAFSRRLMRDTGVFYEWIKQQL